MGYKIALNQRVKMSWFSKLKQGLSKTTSNIASTLTKVFVHKKLDQAALDELEEALILSDMGATAAAQIISDLSKDKFNKDVEDGEVREFLANKVSDILKPCQKDLDLTQSPHIVLMCGVNGNGKTTTIGKLGLKYKQEGKKVLFAACDTFRAAAIDQLKVWADRVGCPIITSEQNADPASVAFKACEIAQKENYDVLLIDTAGRLHNKENLMDELAKVIRVIKKVIPEAPHNTVLVLDATTGQNALAQVETFKSIVNITGLIVTKLDGTAKGGILVAIAKKYNLPMHYIGIGESVEDLDKFEALPFAKALIGMN